MQSIWVHEKEFVKLLDKIVQRATESNLQRLAELAVENESSYFKHVIRIFEKASTRANQNDSDDSQKKKQLNILFALSEILRLSSKTLRKNGRYGERATPIVKNLMLLLAITEHK
ncbi:hypothetical protein CEUSTIGMA_g12633.t1, partial [Chlamydomonas eustigma]